jgi:hypothetical protein
VEVSRKHGPFDTRWPCIRSSGAMRTTTLRAEELAEALDWNAFSVRHLGERGRHDGVGARPAGLSLVPPEPASAEAAAEVEPEETGARRLLAALAPANPRAAQSGLPADQL